MELEGIPFSLLMAKIEDYLFPVIKYIFLHSSCFKILKSKAIREGRSCQNIIASNCISNFDLLRLKDNYRFAAERRTTVLHIQQYVKKHSEDLADITLVLLTKYRKTPLQ